MQRRPIDPSIKLFFRLNSASVPLRTIAIQDARVILDVDDKKWLIETTAGVVPNETVVGGADVNDAPADKRILVF